LSNKRSVVVQDYKGKSFVSIRDFYRKDGKQLPSAKGISLTTEQWSAFKKSIPAIEEAVMKMQSKLRSAVDGDQTDLSQSVTASTHELVPIEINHFDGKNYHSWAAQMEFFLKQLKVAYALADACQCVNFSPVASTKEIAEAKAAQQKWINDDYICHHNIMSCLSDHLYVQYSKKTKSAKELWELKLVYFYEEFGTKRSQVKKYIEFQMVDHRSVTEQVQELNRIADFVVAAGMLFEENFHVNTIISKLSPSWKGFCVKLMAEEYMSFWMLMDRIRIEEESHNKNKQGEPANRLSSRPRIREMKKLGIRWKRQETETDNKAMFCYSCDKNGHISKNCHSKKVVNEINGRQHEDNLTTHTPVLMEVNVVESTEG
ncbi:LOW QUALITY PROTEIN: PC4 domain-containing protein/UBN2_2 domain-containing protein, partial [Cephalotus follicularis]